MTVNWGFPQYFVDPRLCTVLRPYNLIHILYVMRRMLTAHSRRYSGPNITGTTSWFFGDSNRGTVSGAFGQINAQNTNLGGAYTTLAGVQNTFSASSSNALFGANATVQAPARQALMIIRARRLAT